MNEFEEILEKMRIASDKIAGGQRFRKEFSDFVIKDITGEYDELTDEELRELRDAIVSNFKGIDYQFLIGFEKIDELFETENVALLDEIKSAFNKVPTAYGTGLYWKEFLSEVVNLIELFIGVSGDVNFESMGPYSSQQEACDAFAVDGFQDEGKLYLEEETEGVYLVYTDSERTQLANDGIYIINDNSGIIQDDILIIELENGYLQSGVVLSAVCSGGNGPEVNAPEALQIQGPFIDEEALCGVYNGTGFTPNDTVYFDDDKLYTDEELNNKLTEGIYLIDFPTGGGLQGIEVNSVGQIIEDDLLSQCEL